MKEQLDFIKHLIICNCTLRQFADRDPPVFHRFVVFSVINSDGSIKPSLAQCNNCGGIHKVTEVGISTKLKKEESGLLPNIDEIKTSLPEKLLQLLIKYDLDLPTWQEIEFIFNNEMWNRLVILYKETEGNETCGKYLLIVGKTLWKVESFSTAEDVI